MVIEMKETVKNLMQAFVYESQARNRYELYSKTARNEGLMLFSNFFEEIADQEREHATWNYLLLQRLKKDEVFENLKVEIESTTVYGTTIENLKSAIKEEAFEFRQMYPNFAKIAKEEGYSEIAKKINDIVKIERNHFNRLQMLLQLAKDDSLLKRSKINVWKCIECGFEVPRDELPDNFQCPSCKHFKPYFQKHVLTLVQEDDAEKILWVCMECGYEVVMNELPDKFQCPSCNRSKAYFRRRSLKPDHYKVSVKETEKAIWKCIECGYEVVMNELPDKFQCPSCNRSKAYFRRKASKPLKYDVSLKEAEKDAEKAIWTCLECGNEEEVDMPEGWKCPICGYPKTK